MYVFVLYKYFDKFDTDILINLTADMPNVFIWQIPPNEICDNKHTHPILMIDRCH